MHATHLTDHDIALLGDAAVDVLHLRRRPSAIWPTGSGRRPASRDAGVAALHRVSDSHAVIDPFEEARAIELDERLASLRRGNHQPADAARRRHRATGYRCLGWPDGTVAGVGQLADFVTVAFDSPRLAGTDRADHALAAVVFAAAPADVRHVVVGGEHVVCDGVHQRVDVVAAARPRRSAPPVAGCRVDERLRP